MPVDRLPLLCTTCPWPFAELHKSADGQVRLIIKSRHHGQWHINILTPEELVELGKRLMELSRQKQT